MISQKDFLKRCRKAKEDNNPAEARLKVLEECLIDMVDVNLVTIVMHYIPYEKLNALQMYDMLQLAVEIQKHLM